MHGGSDAQPPRERLELGPLLAVADDHQADAPISPPGLGDRLEQQVELLDRHDPADERAEELVVSDAELLAGRGPGLLPTVDEAVEIETQRDDREPLTIGDAEADQVGDRRLADPDQPVGALRQRALEAPVEPVLGRAEVALEDVAVERVDQLRPGTWRDHRGLATEETRLGGVGVDDVGTEAADDPDELGERDRVVDAVDGLHQIGEMEHPGALALGEVGGRLLPGGQPAVDE